MCNDEGTRCIPNNWWCDKYSELTDCPDGEDEANCTGWSNKLLHDEKMISNLVQTTRFGITFIMYIQNQKIESQIMLKSSGARKSKGKQCINFLHKYIILYCSFKLSHNETIIAHSIIIQRLLNVFFYYYFFQDDIILHDTITIDSISFLRYKFHKKD